MRKICFFPADITFLSLLRTQERLENTIDNRFYNIPNTNFYNIISNTDRESYKPIIFGFFKNYTFKISIIRCLNVYELS